MSSVVRVSGSDQGRELDKWQIRPYWAGDGKKLDCGAGVSWPMNGSRDEPQSASLLRAKFSSVFTQSVGSVSEMNVSCDTYRDKCDTQYWIVSEDSKG